jgi:hypothetical protein
MRCILPESNDLDNYIELVLLEYILTLKSYGGYDKQVINRIIWNLTINKWDLVMCEIIRDRIEEECKKRNVFVENTELYNLYTTTLEKIKQYKLGVQVVINNSIFICTQCGNKFSETNGAVSPKDVWGQQKNITLKDCKCSSCGNDTFNIDYSVQLRNKEF